MRADISSSTVFSVAFVSSVLGSLEGAKRFTAPARPVVLSRRARRSWLRSLAFVDCFLTMEVVVVM